MIKIIKSCYTLILFAAFIGINPMNASAGTSPIPNDPAVLCLPGIYLINPGNCNPDGPSSYLTRMAQEGITGKEGLSSQVMRWERTDEQSP